MTQITINKGGTGEKVVEAESLQIHDLWHVAEYLDEHSVKFGSGDSAGEAVRDVWQLAHNLKNHITAEDTPDQFYVQFVWSDVEPQLHGPYDTAEERDAKALELRAEDTEESGIYPIDRVDGKLTTGTYSGGFFEEE